MKKFFLIGLLGALSACGGGGGGSNPVTSPDPSVVISKTNSAQLSSSAGSGDTVTASASSLVPLTAGQTSQTAISLSDFTLKLLHLGTDQTLQALSVTTACPGGGTLTAPSSTATSGTFTFSNCVGYIPNVTLNGSVSFSLSGSSTDKSATVSFQNFTFSDGTTTATIDVSMNINVMTAGTVETTNISYSKFSITVNNDYVNIYNFKSTKTYDTSTLDYTLTWDYTLTAPLIKELSKV